MPGHLRPAAGLLLIFPKRDRAHLTLTIRSESLERHGGQVSLPGGVVERGESFEQAALREASEEIGLDASAVTVLGALTPVDIPVSAFRLHPIVGAVEARPDLHPADGEVARIVDVPLEQLLDPRAVGATTRIRAGRPVEVPAFLTGDLEIWGATGMVLAEFLTLLGWGGPGAGRR